MAFKLPQHAQNANPKAKIFQKFFAEAAGSPPDAAAHTTADRQCHVRRRSPGSPPGAAAHDVADRQCHVRRRSPGSPPGAAAHDVADRLCRVRRWAILPRQTFPDRLPHYAVVVLSFPGI